MYLDIPQLKRCCCCFPLRRGLLALAYVNLLFTLAVIGYGIYEYAVQYQQYSRLFHYGGVLVMRGSVFRVNAELLLAVYCLDAVLLGVLLVGAHKKNILLMRIFYVYGITTTLVTLVLNLCLMRRVYMEELGFLFIGIVLEGYLLLMLRSEIFKLAEDNNTIHYVNRLSDVIINPGAGTVDNSDNNIKTNSSQEKLGCNVYSNETAPSTQ